MIKVLLVALFLSLGVSAMQGQGKEQQGQQQSKPRKVPKKIKKEKITCTKRLGGWEKRVRHYEQNVWTTTKSRCKDKNIEQYAWGDDCVEEKPIEKTVPCEQQEQWQDQVGQDTTQQKRSFKTEVSKNKRPITSNKTVRRKFLGEVTNDVEREETVLETTTWDSESEEEIKGDDCIKPFDKK